MKKGIAILALLLGVGLVFAIQPAGSWTVGTQGKFTPGGAANVVTEGGNVTPLNLSSNISTEKWAGYWGNVTGGLLLSNGVSNFFSWAWTPANGGEVCAVAASSGFDWASVQTVTGAEVDTVWSFAGADTDSAANTLTSSCNVDVAGTAVTGSAGVTTGGAVFETCAVADTGTPAGKGDVAFCVDIASGGTLFNGGTGDYQLLTAADEVAGNTETHYFWLELD